MTVRARLALVRTWNDAVELKASGRRYNRAWYEELAHAMAALRKIERDEKAATLLQLPDLPDD